MFSKIIIKSHVIRCYFELYYMRIISIIKKFMTTSSCFFCQDIEDNKKVCYIKSLGGRDMQLWLAQGPLFGTYVHGMSLNIMCVMPI